MNLRKRPLKNCRLYLVLDKNTAGKKAMIKIAKRAISGGVDVIQLRWKEGDTKEMLKVGTELRKITSRSNTLFIVNDDPYVAEALNADGVHLGQEDLSIKKARSILGRDKIVGYSTHNISQARTAVLEGADYISIGPIFKTRTKPDYKAVGLEFVRQARKEIKIPFFAIGGINSRNIKRVVKNGIKRVAVVRAIVKAKNPDRTARLLKEKLK